jgi:ABC-2 type transport system permease protein
MKKTRPNNNMDLLFELVKTSFTLKYNGSILGFIWVLLKPFMQFTILYIVFSNLGANKNIENFNIYLLVGLVMFSFFQESFMSGVHALLDKAHIILKVNFDKTLAIYSTLLLATINLFINFIIILVFVIFNPIDVTPISFLYFLFLVLVMFILVTGIAFFTSIITVKIRDLQHLVEVGMQLAFYATPIFYKLEIIPEPFQSILAYNPLFIIIQSSREALLYGEIIYVKRVLILACVSLIIFLLGFLFFKSKVTKIAEYF